MRISCPSCGERTHAEFLYRGDAAPERPVSIAGAAPDPSMFVDYVYLRTNPIGWHREYWQHTAGCRNWLVVERNVSTHEIGRVMAARPLAGGAAR